MKWSLLLLLVAVPAFSAEPIGPALQEVSVNIKASTGSGGAQGSGTIFLVPRDGKPEEQITLVITAHHVISDLREVKSVIDEDGSEKKRVRYRDARVVQEGQDAARSRNVGEVRWDAKVLSVDQQRDIALLQVRAVGKFKKSARFYQGKDVPLPGVDVYHCGSPAGQQYGGTCTLSAGIISRTGVLIPDFGGAEACFDQTDIPAAKGGSSGGMVCLKSDGRWIGMITLGLSNSGGQHWFVPVRVVREWAEEIGADWLFDPKAKLTEEMLEDVPLELHRAGFGRQRNPERKPDTLEIDPCPDYQLVPLTAPR